MSRRSSILLLTILVVGVVSGRYLETTINLPDSAYCSRLLYIADVGKLYCGDTKNHAIVVVDGESNTIVKRIALPISGGPWPLCYNPDNRKLYCPGGLESGVTVIVGVDFDSVIAVVESVYSVQDMCWNPVNNKVYCLVYDGIIHVVDGSGDSVAARIELPTYACALCYNPPGNKLYSCHDWDTTVSVIDCASNRILRTVGTVTHPEVLCYNPRQNKVYVSTYSCNALAVLDGATDDELARMSLIDPWCMYFDTTHEELYVSSGSSTIVTVVGGITNRIEDQIPVGTSPGALCLDARTARMYCTHERDSLAIIDCGTHTVTRRFRVTGRPVTMAHNPVFGRTYVFCSDSHCIRVFRDSGVGLAESPPVEDHLGFLPAPTFVRDAVVWNATTPSLSNVGDIALQVGAELLEISGRKVMDLQPGENDIRHVAPGVYFIRAKAEGGRLRAEQKIATHKIVIQR